MGRRTFRTEDNECEFKVLMLNKFGLLEEQKAKTRLKHHVERVGV